MARLSYREIHANDLKDQQLIALNDIIREIVDECNRLAGFQGPIQLENQIDMQGNRIINLGTASTATDALDQTAADTLYGVAVQQQNMEVVGTKILQTTRRLNDPTQQEQSSTFLKTTTSTPPGTNNSSVSVVNNGATSTATVTAGTYTYADGSTDPYAQAQLTINNPGADTYYYIYFRFSDKTLQFDGPYSALSSLNAFNSNLDGHGQIGSVKFTAGGGGGGGGGSSTGGCAEVGSLIELPEGASAEMVVVECNDWYEVITEGNHRVLLAPNTLVSVFIPVQRLEEWMLAELHDGEFEKVKSLARISKRSYKMSIVVPGKKTYWANGIRLHNLKPNGN